MYSYNDFERLFVRYKLEGVLSGVSIEQFISMMDYKAIDTQKIRDYIDAVDAVVTVDDIIRNANADKLRVYPALFELEQEGYIEVTEREELGAPSVVCRRKD